MADFFTSLWRALTSPPLIGIATAFLAGMLGGFLAHRLALSRDKRKEYNDLIFPVRKLLSLERDNPGPHSDALFRLSRIDGLSPLLGPMQRHRLSQARARYEKTLTEIPTRRDQYGIVLIVGDASEITKCCKSLLNILKPH